MKRSYGFVLCVLAIPFLFAGCKGNTAKEAAEKPEATKGQAVGVNSKSVTPDGEGSVRAALAKLGAEDGQLAKAQGFCPKSGKALGSMGMPVKVMLKGVPVFLCCEGCEDDARQHADQMLAKVEELKAKAKASPTGR